MGFDYPWWLAGLALLPVIVILRRAGWGQKPAVPFPEARSAQAAFGGGRRPGSGLGEILRVTALAVLIIAAARPRVVHSEQMLTATGLDIILALDMSGSMSARDFGTLNRLQAAKAVLREFVSSEHNNRLGLVAFAARAFTVCPLTLDYQVLLTLLDHLAIGMTTDGTAIGMAIATGLQRLKSSAAKAKVIILLTDGRNNAGALDPLTAAQLAEALNVRIYTIGMGQPGGGPIPIQDPLRGESLLLNPDGSVHMEGLDEDTLARIAQSTGGAYYRATDKKKLQDIYLQIGELERSRLRAKSFKVKTDVGFWLMGAAWGLILAGLIFVPWRERQLP